MSQDNQPDSSSRQPSPFYHMYNNFYNNNNNNNKKQTSDTHLPHQQAPLPPPPYSPNDTSYNGSIPSAPPLDEPLNQNTYNPPLYPPPSSPSSPLQNNAYPPQGYGQYGTVPRYPSTNTPANATGWPWIAPQPPIIPIQQEQRPKPTSICELITKCFVYCLFFILIMDFVKLVWWGVGPNSCENNGAIWTELPSEIPFENDLRISVVGGHLTGGSIAIRETNDEFPTGTILPQLRVGPKSILEDKDLGYVIKEDGNETHFELHLPSQYNMRYCIHLEMTLYVPRHLNALTIDVQNTYIQTENDYLFVDKLSLTTTNKMIGIGSEWQGKSLALASTNARISLDGPALGDSVTLRTTNARISTKKVVATKLIQLASTNGVIETQDLTTQKDVKISSSNANLYVQSIKARNVNLATTNARIDLTGSEIDESITAITSNSEMKIHIDKGKNIIADVKTTNASPLLFMPTDFEGELDLKTSASNRVKVIDPSTWLHIHTMGRGFLLASRYESEESQNLGHVLFHTSNANLQIFF